jgi:multidrug resistance protein, MATE family
MAKRISTLCMVVTFTWSVSIMLLVYFGRETVSSFYTLDEDVKSTMNTAWPILCVFVFFDCMQGVSAGNISGLGLMAKVKWVTAFSYWIVGIPLSIYLTFV